MHLTTREAAHLLNERRFIGQALLKGINKVLRQFQWVGKYELRRRIFNREDEPETRVADKFN